MDSTPNIQRRLEDILIELGREYNPQRREELRREFFALCLVACGNSKILVTN